MGKGKNNSNPQSQFWLGMARTVAHDMGTPLSSIMGWLELLPSLKDPANAIEEINASLDRLNQLSLRLEQVGCASRLEIISLQTVLDNAISFMRKRLSTGTQISIESHLERDVKIEGRQELLEWAFECLLKNSVDAIPDNRGRIELRVSGQGNEAIVELDDSGSGIPVKDKRRIFDPGFTTKRSGRGVGLSLARHIFEEIHGGKIELASSLPDQGTTFRITLNRIQKASSQDEEAP
jgi:signal transduction histidine kinase